jgi:hypothetical protein
MCWGRIRLSGNLSKMIHPAGSGSSVAFLISQPRSGSTLLQRILGRHPSVATRSEPWILLPGFYTLKPHSVTAEYDAEIAGQAMSDFLSQIPAGEDEYCRRLAELYETLYRQAAELNGAAFFLDKTPRYYLILEEILTYFPLSPIILLFRNPIAVLASIYRDWLRPPRRSLGDFKNDLLVAPKLMLHAAEYSGVGRTLTLTYEHLVGDPDATVAQAVGFLGLTAESALHEYGSPQDRWPLGDQESVYRLSRPEPDMQDRWVDELRDPQLRAYALGYLDALGDELVSRLGYEYRSLREQIETYTSRSLRRVTSFEEAIAAPPASNRFHAPL